MTKLAALSLAVSLPLSAHALEIGEFSLFESQQATIPASNATPNTLIRLAATGQGEGMGPCPPPLLGACLDLIAPKVLATATSNGSGDVNFTWTPPAGSLGRDVSFQAMEVAGGVATLSDPVTVTITLPPADHQLTALTPVVGTLSPAFDPEVTSYILSGTAGAALTAFIPEAGANTEIVVDGSIVASGVQSPDIAIDSPDLPGGNYITITSEDLVGSQGSTTYTVEVSNLIEETLYVKMENADDGDSFGEFLAMSGNRVAIAAWSDNSAASGINSDETDNSASNAGSVATYVKDELTGLWSREAYIKPFNAGSGDQFGIAIDMDGDRLIVGANSEDSAGSGVNSGTELDNSLGFAGAAYIFVVDPGTGVWTQEAYLKANTPGSYDGWGGTVAIGGDVAVAGNIFIDSAAGGGTGSADVFERDPVSGLWSYITTLAPASLGYYDNFAASMAVCDERIMVGVPNEDSIGTGINSGTEGNNSFGDAGAVFVFAKDPITGDWVQDAYIKREVANSNQFGGVVACDDNMLVVGVSGAYVAELAIYSHDGVAWSYDATIDPRDSVQGFQGFAVDENIVLDAENGLLAAGVKSEDSSGTGVNSGIDDFDNANSGAVFVWRLGDDGVWREKFHVKASNPDANDNFGHGVGLDNNILVVGSPNEQSTATGFNGNSADNSGDQIGAAYIFEEVF